MTDQSKIIEINMCLASVEENTGTDKEYVITGAEYNVVLDLSCN